MSRLAIVLLVTPMIFSANAFAQNNPWYQTPIDCNRSNERYQCGSACQTTCSNLGQACPIVNVVCNPGCYCKDGYARIDDDNSRCIPTSECPRRTK